MFSPRAQAQDLGLWRALFVDAPKVAIVRTSARWAGLTARDGGKNKGSRFQDINLHSPSYWRAISWMLEESDIFQLLHSEKKKKKSLSTNGKVTSYVEICLYLQCQSCRLLSQFRNKTKKKANSGADDSRGSASISNFPCHREDQNCLRELRDETGTS